MTRWMPSLAVLGLVLAGCAGQPGPDKETDPVDTTSVSSLHQATIEVKGMT